MGRKYSSPTVYRDKCCPTCGFYFTARGLNGHIRFYHDGFEKGEIRRLKTKLFDRAMVLSKHAPNQISLITGRLGGYSDATLQELREIEAFLDTL